MRTAYENSLEYQILERLKKLSSAVILRQDLDGVGSYRQVSRVLNKLVNDKVLIKLSMGVYAKAYISKYSDVPLIEGGTDMAFRSALERLGIAFESGSAEQAYNAGLSTQIPAQNIIKLKSRCRRKISYGNKQLIFEKNINAR